MKPTISGSLFRHPLAAGLALFLTGIGAATEVKLADYFDQFPVRSAFATAADAPVVAWTEQNRGTQEIWIATGSPLRPRKVFEYAGDDGQPLADLQLTADGQTLVYIRGSRPNAQGEINNPNNRPDPTERVLLSLALGGGESRRLVAGTSPAFHTPRIRPGSAAVAYARGKDVWLADLAGGNPQRLFTLRGSAAQLAWSPDGRSLAFVSQRGTHSFVGVFDVAARTIRYFDPGIDRDQRPVWSPDGTRVAFVRGREEVQRYRFSSDRAGIPWSIMVADVASGAVRTAWTAEPGPGSALGELGTELFWPRNDRLLFVWEKTGWRQLYTVAPEGGPAAALTKGEGEIAFPTVARDGAAVYFQANDSLRERFDLFRVPLNGGARELIEGGRGIQDFGVLCDGRVVFNGHRPGNSPVLAAGGFGAPPAILAAPPVPSGFPTDGIVEPGVVDLKAEDDLAFRGLLFRPPGMKPGDKRPALVYLHGGSRNIEALLSYRPGNRALVQAFVRAGYVVLVPNYRSGTGYGLNFREAEGYGGGGGTDTLDVNASGRFLATLPGVDPAKLGVYGISYGGYLTTAALARAPKLWAAGVSIVGVGDWQMELELDAGGRPLPFRVSERAKAEDLAFQSSANAYLKDWRAPILFISGGDDQEGWVDQAVELGQSLRRRGITVEALVEPGGTHGPATYALQLERARRTKEFFDRQLKAP